ncbi:MAG: nitric oxide reductase, partial [Nitrospira sp.]|nr:nitric oxide reductase [Nitrospira sp.]
MISEALSMGWMAMAILAGLLVYFQVSIGDPAAKKRAVFKTFIGIVATFLLFMAIANYKNNFYGENRLLPVSLVIITVTSF